MWRGDTSTVATVENRWEIREIFKAVLPKLITSEREAKRKAKDGKIKKRPREQKAGEVRYTTGEREKEMEEKRRFIEKEVILVVLTRRGSLVQSSHERGAESNRPPTTSSSREEDGTDAYLAGGLHVRRRRGQHHRRRRRAERAVLAAAGGRAGAGAVVERRRRAAPRAPRLLLRPRGARRRRRGAAAARARALPARHRRPGRQLLLPRVAVGGIGWFRWPLPRRRPAGEVGAAERADDVGGRRDHRAGLRVDDGGGHGRGSSGASAGAHPTGQMACAVVVVERGAEEEGGCGGAVRMRRAWRRTNAGAWRSAPFKPAE